MLVILAFGVVMNLFINPIHFATAAAFVGLATFATTILISQLIRSSILAIFLSVTISSCFVYVGIALSLMDNWSCVLACVLPSILMIGSFGLTPAWLTGRINGWRVGGLIATACLAVVVTVGSIATHRVNDAKFIARMFQGANHRSSRYFGDNNSAFPVGRPAMSPTVAAVFKQAGNQVSINARREEAIVAQKNVDRLRVLRQELEHDMESSTDVVTKWAYLNHTNETSEIKKADELSGLLSQHTSEIVGQLGIEPLYSTTYQIIVGSSAERIKHSDPVNQFRMLNLVSLIQWTQDSYSHQIPIQLEWISNPDRTELELCQAIIELEQISPEVIINALEAAAMSAADDPTDPFYFESIESKLEFLPWEKERARVLLKEMRLSNASLVILNQIQTANVPLNWTAINYYENSTREPFKEEPMFFGGTTRPAVVTASVYQVNRYLILRAALEIYRLRHGQYPQQLGDLRPNILSIVPTKMEGQDFYYAPPKRDHQVLIAEPEFTLLTNQPILLFHDARIECVTPTMNLSSTLNVIGAPVGRVTEIAEYVKGLIKTGNSPIFRLPKRLQDKRLPDENPQSESIDLTAESVDETYSIEVVEAFLFPDMDITGAHTYSYSRSDIRHDALILKNGTSTEQDEPVRKKETE